MPGSPTLQDTPQGSSFRGAPNAAPSRVGIFTILNPHQHGGLETYIRELTAQLQQRGCHVQWNGATPPDSPDMMARWQPRVQRLLPLMTRSATRGLAQRLAEWQGTAQFAQDLQQVDVAHFVGVGWNLLGFPLVRAARRRGLVTTCWPAVHPGQWGDAPLDVTLYQKMDTIFTQSDHERDHLQRLGISPERLLRCGCGSPQATPGKGKRFRSKYLLNDRPLVTFVGRKDRGKGYHALREAIAQLAAQGLPITLASIGREAEPPYPPLPVELDLDLGAADESTKHDALAACDVFALPSAGESFGIVYVEAWAYGKPVLCGTAPASRELIARHAGGLASDGTAEDIATQLRRLFADRSTATGIGQAGRQAVAQEYTWQRVADRHLTTWTHLREPA